MRITVKEARDKRGLTPEQLADQAGLHRATVYRIEAGQKPSYDTVKALEKALKVKPGTLAFGEAA